MYFKGIILFITVDIVIFIIANSALSSASLQYSPERSSAILLACCVLHNAFLQSGFDAWAAELAAPVEQPDGAEQRTEENDGCAEEIRRNLILKHFG